MSEEHSSLLRLDQLAVWNVNVEDTNHEKRKNCSHSSCVWNLKMFGGSAQPSLFLVRMMTSYTLPGIMEWKVKVNLLAFFSMVGMMLVQSDVSA